jgi:hypothetical protein
VIDTREELVHTLSEAAELEHGLMVQYLYAAYSIKRRLDEGITPVQQALLVDWEATILGVAHEEMYHLANVCNLLSAIGGAPQFTRPNFPQPMDAYYPFDFQLEPLNDNSLYRFAVFELPEGEPPPPAPQKRGRLAIAGMDIPAYNHVGELYARISEGFESIPERDLFIGRRPHQDVEDWGLRLKLHLVKDLESAQKAITEIVEEGEGSPGAREGSHYDRFLQIRRALGEEIAKAPDFEPARPVVNNPWTRKHRDASGGYLIEHGISRELAELFNDIYFTMLLMLIQYFSYGTETQAQRRMLRDSCRRMMSAVIRPLAEVLTEMPASNDPDGERAGPGFEFYTGLRLAPDRDNQWTILRERFGREVEGAKALMEHAGCFPVLARLERVAEAMQGTLINLTGEFGGDS